MKIIICVAAVVVAFFVGWNAAQLRWLDKISDINTAEENNRHQQCGDRIDKTQPQLLE